MADNLSSSQETNTYSAHLVEAHLEDNPFFYYAIKRQEPVMPRQHDGKSLDDLPDEVLQHILYFVEPNDALLRTQLVSKRLYILSSQPLLWRYHCRFEYDYWDARHQIRKKFDGGVSEADWKALYIYRRKVEKVVGNVLGSIIESQTGRIAKYKGISVYGYDAKDPLISHCNAEEDQDDVLARRYYANSVLDHIHRGEALAAWQRLQNGENVRLEHALGAFDLFVLHDQIGDLNEISESLDNVASHVLEEYPRFEEDLTTRQKALTLARFLRTHNLVGCDEQAAYRDLQNNYLGIALQHQDHASLPLISVAIYVCVANRLNVDARVCGVPAHVHAVVIAPDNETLDGRAVVRVEDAEEAMFLDPFRSDREVPVEVLHRFLASWSIPSGDFSRYLRGSHPNGLVVRTSRNILASIQEFRAQPVHVANYAERFTMPLHANTNPYAEIENAYYSALWCNFIFGRPEPSPHEHDQRQIVPLILEKYERLYPMDCDLVEKYISPLYSHPDEPGHLNLRETLRVVRAADSTPKQRRARDTHASREGVKYRVGQVFRHRRYAYIAVIVGWDVECGMNPHWIATNGVDNLSRGRNQSFYHALVEDTSIRYVAEENIEILQTNEIDSLKSLAGRYFKRWDSEKSAFVSNIRDEYPDD